MAKLLDFKKAWEGEGEVEYVFGYRGDMNRRLVIEKESRQGKPLDGNRDSNFGAVCVKIRRFYESETRWPESGTYAA
jgi:hypothetical protein